MLVSVKQDQFKCLGYKRMVVIFIDVLGTKNNHRFEDKYFFHRLFHEEVEINEQRNLQHVIYTRKVYSFSDCVYFFYYYKDGIEDIRKDDMKLLELAMLNTANSVLRILNSGYLVRGGVAFGDVYFDELGFFGPAVEKAYELESNYADVPIIALAKELGQKYCCWDESETDLKLVNKLITSPTKLVEQENGKYFINVFYTLEVSSPELSLENETIKWII